MKTLLVVLSLVLVGAVSVLAIEPPLPPDVVAALDSAGANRPELEKVLAHYRAPEDSLKFLAACFLIGNMEGHSYVTYALLDSTSHEIPFEALNYTDFDSLERAYGSLEKQHGVLDFKKKMLTEDLASIKSGFLIDNIDYAFRAWQERPWARTLTFDQFCRYVLPYRGSNEPLDPWRAAFFEQYADVSAKLVDSTDAIAAANLINEQVMSWFKFDKRFYYHPTDQGLTEMQRNKAGRCEDMTNLTIYAMRANGLAVTSDYTPFWADYGNNHAWNAILVPGGKVIPFMGAEANPGQYALAHRLAKAYRKTYEKHPENLIFQKRKQEKVPGWLGGKNYIDVTTDYTKICDVTISLASPVPDSVDIAYLCVFNSGQWQAIQWGRIANTKVTFAAMGTEIAYLPAYYLNQKVMPAGTPFILRDDCTMTSLAADSTKTSTVQLLSTEKTNLESTADGILKSGLTSGTEYELFFWDGDWKSVGKAVATDRPLVFDKLPANGLYWLTATGSNKEERIFTIDGVTQVWW